MQWLWKVKKPVVTLVIRKPVEDEHFSLEEILPQVVQRSLFFEEKTKKIPNGDSSRRNLHRRRYLS